jgi:hypothetical protein
LTAESKSQVPENLYVLKIGGKTIGPILLTDIPKHLVDIQNTFVWDNEKLIWKHIFVVDEIVKFCQIKNILLTVLPKIWMWIKLEMEILFQKIGQMRNGN